MTRTNGHRRALLVTLPVLAIAVTAGCGALPESPDADRTVTPAPVPTDADAPVAPPVSLPAGVEDGELASPAALAAAHRDRLGDRSFRWIERRDRRVYENGSLVRRVTLFERTWVGEGGRARRDVARRVAEDGTVAWYNRSRYDGDIWYLMVETRDERRVVGGDQPGPRSQYATGNAAVVGKHLSLVSSRAYPIQERRYLIRGEGSHHPEFAFSEGYTARALVDSSGLVRQLSASYDETVGDRRKAVSYELTVRGVGTTDVPRPAWLPANATTVASR